MRRDEGGQDRAALVERYARGECMALAATPHRATGHPPDLDRRAFLDGHQGRRTELRPVGLGDLKRIWDHRDHPWEAPHAHLATLGLDRIAAPERHAPTAPRHPHPEGAAK